MLERVARCEVGRSSAETIKTRVSDLARSASFEVTAREILNGGIDTDLPLRDAKLYIPSTPNTRWKETVDAAGRVQARGLTAVPHIAARRVGSERELLELLAGLRDAGCREAFLIGGAATPPRSGFGAAMDLLRTGSFQRHGFARIGVAGHPEGSPDIGDAALEAALMEKNRYSRQARIDMHVVTQFCFSPSPIEAWERRIRVRGNRLPVHVGVPGLTSTASLLRFAGMCGVRLSADLVRSGLRLIPGTRPGWSPAPILLMMAACMASSPDCLFSRVHFFPFGGLRRTVRWAQALAEGGFELQDGPSGLEIEVLDE